MGLINKYSKGDWVNQNRKSQGGVLEKQDAKSRFFSEKMNNGNNIQKKTTAKIDDLPNIPAMLGSAPSQDSIKPIDGGTAHTPTTQALLPFLTLLSAAFPNTTAPPNKAIDNSNSSLSRVTSPTKVNTHVLFGTTPSTSKNHAQSKKLTKHSDDPSLIREKDGLIRHDDGNIILGSGGSKLTVSYDLDIKILKEQLTNNINITELCLWALKIDPQEVQEIGEILKGSNVEVLSILHSNIRDTGTIDFGRMLTNTKVTILNLAYNGIGNKGAIGLIESLEGTNVEELNLSHNGIGKTGKGAKGFITLLKKTKVKVVDLSHNNMSDKKVNDIIPELEKNTKIIVLGLRGMGIKHDTLKEVLKVLKQNKHVNEKSYTSTVESSTTEEKASTTEEKSPNTSNKREKRDVHTTSSTEDTTVPTTEESTVPTTLKSSTTTTEPTTPTTVST
ncbi:MAG: hypothetical protein PV347_06560, partial [Rickettsiaceae bacterium]|nr:hypothetical protein [Rickettsiaceae bacterium]